MKLRFTQVVFGMLSIPILLNATIRQYLMKYEATDPRLIKKLQRSLSVEDSSFVAKDEKQAH